MAAAEASVLLKRIGAVQQVVLNRPKVLNSLNLEMVRSLAEALPSWRAGELAAVVLKGAGGKAFCAGGDIKKIFEDRGKPETQMAFFCEEYVLDRALAEHSAASVPHVALWDGTVMGGGVGVSIHAAFRVATERTVFAMPETGIGFFPDVGGSFFLPRLRLVPQPGGAALPEHAGAAFGLYLALTGARLSGADVVHAGVATHFVPSAAVPALEEGLARLAAPGAGGASAAAAAISGVLSGLSPSPLPAFSYSLGDLALIADAFHPGRAEAEGVEGVLAAVDKAASGGSGPAVAVSAAAALRRVSPTSLKVTAEQLRRGAALSLAECFKQEERMATAFMGGHDFYEGVRALLVDRTGKPAWSPARLEEVSKEAVLAHF